MLKRLLLPAALLVGAALWPATGCTPPPPPAAPPVTPPTVGSAPPKNDEQPRDMADTAAVKEAVNEEIKKHGSSFPKGTVLESVTVHDRIAALDFSPQFNKLGNLGDTTEANAQKVIRHALAQFPIILKMTVTVQGKPYDSQMEDWTTPFPVRQTLEEIDASKAAEKDAAHPAESKPQGGGG